MEIQERDPPLPPATTDSAARDPPLPPATSDPAARDPPASADPLVEVPSGDINVTEQPLNDAKAQNPLENGELADEGSPPVTENDAVASGDASIYHALFGKIVRQVEFYFSDKNLPTDKFLLKQVRKDNEGYVPITVISSFKKMKKLTEDVSLIVAALRTASLVVVSSDGKKVKPLLNPENFSEVAYVRDANAKYRRTVFVENLPEDYSEDNIRRIFGTAGHIVEVTIHDPHSVEQAETLKKADLRLSNKLHAFVEYDTVEAAESAVSTLNDEGNWRNGLGVQFLLERMAKYGLFKKQWKTNDAEALEICKELSTSIFEHAKSQRTVRVENLPEDYSEDNIRRIFGTAGHIIKVTILDRHSADLRLSSAKLRVFVEYDTVEAAESAVSTLNDEGDWRNGMRVQLVMKRKPKLELKKGRFLSWKDLEKKNGVEGATSKPMPGPDRAKRFTKGRRSRKAIATRKPMCACALRGYDRGYDPYDDPYDECF